MKAKGKVKRFRCGSVWIDYHKEISGVDGRSCSGENTKGTARIFRVTIAEGEYIDLAYMVWDTGDRDVRAETVRLSNPALRRLEHGLRLGIDTIPNSNLSVMELRQARIKNRLDPKKWSTCVKATLDDLGEGAGINVERTLRRTPGFVNIGSKQDVLGESGIRREFLCATFQRDAPWPPIVAYVLTRVLPLGGDHAIYSDEF